MKISEVCKLLEYQEYEKIKLFLDRGIIKIGDIKLITKKLFNSWDFKVINILMNYNIILEDDVNMLILNNNNLVACATMLSELPNLEAILANIKILIERSKKNIHTYNLTFNVLRNIIISAPISYDLKSEIIDIYLSKSDLENIYLLIDKLESIEDLELNMLLAYKLNETIYNFDNEIENYISKYSNIEKISLKK